MKKMMFAIIFMIIASLGYSTLCYADTVAVPYGDSGTVMQTGPQNGGSYSRTDMVYIPGTDTTYDSIYSNGITDDRYFNVNGVQYTQITTSYGNTGMATVTVAPVSANAVPTDMDAYNMAYLSALQSYGLTIDPVTGQIANIAQLSQY